MAFNPYAFGSSDKANADALNRITADIALRLATLERLSPTLAAAADNLVAVGLGKINEQLLPLFVQEAARVERGVLIAGSETPVALVVGANVTMTIDEADWLSFSPSTFVALTRTSTLHDYATLRTQGWDKTTGLYQGQIVAVQGDPGPWADWQLGSQAGTMLAQLALLAEAQALHPDFIAMAAAADADALATAADRAAINSKLIVSPLPPSGGNDGDIWFKV